MIIELEIYKYMKELGFPVYMEVPKERPAEFITIEKTGGQYLGNGIYSGTLAVQTWDKTRYTAAELSSRVCEALNEAPFNVDGVMTASGSDYDFTDTTTKRYRYQALYTFKYIGGK